MAGLEGRVAPSKRVVAIVGASSGIGRATALQCLALGDSLVLIARRSGPLRELVRDVVVTEKHKTNREGTSGGSSTAPLVIEGDIRQEDTGDRIVAESLSTFGRIDVLVYAAGWNVPLRSINDATLESWRTIMETNVTGAFNVTKAIVPHMRRQGGGLLIYIGSSGAKRPDRSGVAYQASKSALTALAHATREECRDDHIRTSVIFPGTTNTPFLEHRPTPTDEGARQLMLQPDDVAAACVFVMNLPSRAHVPELLIYPSNG